MYFFNYEYFLRILFCFKGAYIHLILNAFIAKAGVYVFHLLLRLKFLIQHLAVKNNFTALALNLFLRNTYKSLATRKYGDMLGL